MLVFVRHGEVHNPAHLVYADLPGFDLSPLGVRQAADAAEHLAALPVRAVWSSPLVRALRTAAPIAARHGLPVRVDPALGEWALLTRWRGVGWDDLDQHFPGELGGYLADPTDLPFSDESLVQLAERMAATAVSHLHTGDGVTVIVSHQDPIHAAVRLLTGEGFDDFRRDKPDHAEPILLAPGDPWQRVRAER